MYCTPPLVTRLPSVPEQQNDLEASFTFPPEVPSWMGRVSKVWKVVWLNAMLAHRSAARKRIPFFTFVPPESFWPSPDQGVKWGRTDGFECCHVPAGKEVTAVTGGGVDS
jgi:hypothetical protein